MSARIDIHPVTDLEVVNLGADGFDDTCRVQPENRREFRQRVLREPFDPVGEDVVQVRHDPAGLDLDQYFGRTNCGHGHLLDDHGFTAFIQTCGAHSFCSHDLLQHTYCFCSGT
ncbi:hypothetical protein D3C87_1798500 [compost metagenome]